MEKISEEVLENINGGSIGGDMAWGALGGGFSGALELAEFGPGGACAGFIIGSAYGALGAAMADGFRYSVGWN